MGAESRGEKKSLKQSGNKADGRGSQQKGVEEICNDQNEWNVNKTENLANTKFLNLSVFQITCFWK